MTKDDMEIVSALQKALADKVGTDRYELWFGANTRLELGPDALKVAVSNTFYEDWLRKHFRTALDEVCAAVLGRTLSVTFVVDERLRAPREASTAESAANAPAAAPTSTSPAAAAQAPHEAQPRVPHGAAEPRSCDASTGRRRFESLESFVVGAGNRLAVATAEEVVDRPGRVSPIVFYGPTGVGKTHLLEGIWGAVKRHRARAHAVYLSAEQFTSYFLEALRTSGVPNFRGKYRGVEILLIDDLQFFAGKKATIGELVHTIDALVRAGRQLVFTCDRPPTALAGLGPELSARLSAGLACQIDTPDFATRVGILHAQAARFGIELPADVADWVAAHFCQHARELTGALLKLRATSRALSRPITVGLAEETLADTASRARRPVKLPDVQQAVCEIFGIEPESLRSGRRTTAIAHPRMLAMWLARKHTRAALNEISEFFGKRSHTTVISANKKVTQWMHGPEKVRISDRTLTVAEIVRKVEERLMAS